MRMHWFTMIVAFLWSMTMGIAILALIGMWNAEQTIVAMQKEQQQAQQSCNLMPLVEN